MSQKSKAKSKGDLRVMPEEDPEFQIAPMIDILLVLLVFFMSISSTQVLQANQKVQLPIAAKAKTKKEGTPGGQVILNVLWLDLGNSGSYNIDDRDMDNANAVIPLLQERLKNNPKLRILIRADRKAPYSFVRPLLVAIGQAGALNITFSVIDKEDSQKGGTK